MLIDWNLDPLFRRDIVQLNVGRTERFAMAHYEPGDDIVRQVEPADLFYVILNDFEFLIGHWSQLAAVIKAQAEQRSGPGREEGVADLPGPRREGAGG